MPEEAIELVDANTTLAEVDTAMESFEEAMKGVSGRAESSPEKSAPAATPVQKEQAQTAPESNIPEELRGLNGAPEKTKEAEPDFDALMKETPQGQIKHSHYKTLQTAADAKIKALQGELTKSLQAIEEAQKRGVPEQHAKELEELKAKLMERDTILEKRFYADSPAFREKFGARDAQLSAEITQAAKDYNISEEDMSAITNASGKHRAQLISALELEESEKGDLRSLFRQRDMHEADKRSALERSREGLTEYNRAIEEQKLAKQKQMIEQQNKAFDTVKGRVLQKVGAFHLFADDDSFNASGLKELAGVTSRSDWEKAVTTRIESATKFYNGEATDEELAEAGFKSAAYDFVLAMNKGLRAELAAARQREGKLSAATPGNGQPTGHKPDTSNLTPEQHAENTWDAVVAPVIRR